MAIRHFPVATYRLQFHAGFTFADAKRLVPYLEALGISHVYASPIWRANPGSLHGYDVIDHATLNPELGTMQEFEELVHALKERQMGLIVDIVPNHMHVANDNDWWFDVLENGPSSPHAAYFDIDWMPPRGELVNKVLLPVLDEQFGDALEAQKIKVCYQEGSFRIALSHVQLPTDPASWSLILEPIAREMAKEMARESSEEDPDLMELQSIITQTTHLPSTITLDEEKIAERQREKEVIKRRLQTLFEKSELLQRACQTVLGFLNGKKQTPRSFDSLESFLKEQPYRLSYWQVASDEINYRRFFDVSSLAGIRTEKKDVFDAIHALVFDFVEKGYVDGLRLDHIDGLLNPEKYLRDLQEVCCGKNSDELTRNELFYVVGEKILTGNEKLRKEWPFHGSVGYEILQHLQSLFVVSSHKKVFAKLYASFTEIDIKPQELIFLSKKEILLLSLSSELHVLARYLDRISQQHRSSRDFTIEGLRSALRDTIASFPVYRSYIDAPNEKIEDEDRQYVVTAIQRAKRVNPATASSIFDFLQSVLLLKYPPGITEEQKIERQEFVMRFQQLTSPVMAKGVEDTAFYRYYPLACLNEVGCDLTSFGTTLDAFHEKNIERLESWPYALSATSTHDTKRSEDVRMRLAVLSEIPDEWQNALFRWSCLTDDDKAKAQDEVIPDANEEYLLYQTLIGTWPIHPLDEEKHAVYIRRIQAYMEKALKEAKVRTSWINPNPDYDEMVAAFIQKILREGDNPFREDFEAFVAKCTLSGMLNSLNQTLLKITLPGTPDIYQGNELFDFSLVDPDNRRDVCYAERQKLLDEIGQSDCRIDEMLKNPYDSKIKLFVTKCALQFRKKEKKLFSEGSYVPLQVKGPMSEHIISFARVYKSTCCIVVSSRFFSSLVGSRDIVIDPKHWQDMHLLLPENVAKSSFVDRFTNKRVQPDVVDGTFCLDLHELLQPLPFALLDIFRNL